VRYPLRIAAAAAVAFVVLSVNPALAGPATHSWSGCYAGAHAGGLRGDVAHRIDGAASLYTRDVTFSAATLGVHAGCNYQSGSLVLGVEGDLNWAPVDDKVLVFSGGGIDQYWRDGFDRYATLRARLGIAADRWHLYVTGGASFANLVLTFEDFENGAPRDRFARSSTNGLVAGFGVEYAMQPEWIARLEYFYHHFDNRLLFDNGDNALFRANDPHFHVVRVGITRKFGPQP
jgi:opacity protein-like surface antigen